MRLVIVALSVGLVVRGAAASQALPSGPPAGGPAPLMVRAAGMPLPDGALPPGSLTVRVVQGAFTANLSGIPVEVQVAGQPALRAQTGALGRAEFAHLPIGVEARALAVVNGARLESEAFRIPADSGVRVLLIAGGEAASHGAGGAPPALPVSGQPESAATSWPAEAPAVPRDAGVRIVQITVVTLTLLAFAAVFVHQRRRITGR